MSSSYTIEVTSAELDVLESVLKRAQRSVPLTTEQYIARRFNCSKVRAMDGTPACGCSDHG